jgi:hypothetical protein
MLELAATDLFSNDGKSDSESVETIRPPSLSVSSLSAPVCVEAKSSPCCRLNSTRRTLPILCSLQHHLLALKHE